jgi:UDP-N-acetylmuramyl pentapeptide synthase
VVDGSYNGGYQAIREGIASILPLTPTHMIIPFLGDMRELGDETESMHRELGEHLK